MPEESRKRSVQSVLHIFNEAYGFTSQNIKTETSVPKADGKKYDKKVKTNNESSDEESIEKKKLKMKTASDVLNRIIWDKEISKEFVTVGYMDRFLGLKECAFDLFDWGDIVEADLGELII